MPNVAKIGPYRFFFYSNENDEPPHVHVALERRLAKFWLDPVELADSAGFPAHTLRELFEIVNKNRKKFLEHWNEHFHN